MSNHQHPKHFNGYFNRLRWVLKAIHDETEPIAEHTDPLAITDAWKTVWEQIEELQKYKTACEGINPDNPMAVAENLKDVELFLHNMKRLKYLWVPAATHAPEHEGEVQAMSLGYDKLEELLTKIQSK